MNRTAASAMLLAAAAILAGDASAKSTDRNQTLNAESDTSDCRMVDNAPCILSGNVKITQGTLDIQAARADFTIRDGDIRVAKLTGSPVRMSQEMDNGGRMNATASRIDYDLAQDTIVLLGNASIQQPGHGSIAGERIVYNTRTGQMQGGGEGSRVRLQFEPRNRPAAQSSGGGSD
ncbi:MAG: lipopolysaccharide transport periplasmic protein LptA [Luteimonas sp.]|nr:lipopolysaccharide transport periplasmic protein LptA [Luteimonas sp.]